MLWAEEEEVIKVTLFEFLKSISKKIMKDAEHIGQFEPIIGQKGMIIYVHAPL